MKKEASKKTPDKQGNNREKVGRGSPPKETRWKPGQSGNPKGRPKSITLSEALRAQLGQVMPNADEKTYAEKIALVLCEEATKGNVGAAKEIADRTEGKPRQTLDVDMSVMDWRALAHAHGLDLRDVVAEAERIIKESSLATGH